MEIYNHGTRMFMIMEVNDTYSAVGKKKTEINRRDDEW